MNNDDAVAVVLANRCFLYRYLWRLFAFEPDEDLLSTVQSDRVREALDLADSDDSRLVDGHRLLLELLEDQDMDALKSEYVKLFIGPGEIPAPLWESVYVVGEDLLFQQSTLDVREAYRAAGFQAAGYPHEADDHVGIELDFMATLAEKTLEAWNAGNRDEMADTLLTQDRFLEEHLHAWLPAFVDRLNSRAPHGVSRFYPSAAALTREVCFSDGDILKELIAVIDA